MKEQLLLFALAMGLLTVTIVFPVLFASYIIWVFTGDWLPSVLGLI